MESVATWLNNVFPFMIGVHFGRPINVDVVIAVMGGLDDRVCLLIESRLRDEPASCIFESSEGLDSPLCANMTETSCVTAISEQGGKENQHGNDERFCPARCGCDGSI